MLRLGDLPPLLVLIRYMYAQGCSCSVRHLRGEFCVQQSSLDATVLATGRMKLSPLHSAQLELTVVGSCNRGPSSDARYVHAGKVVEESPSMRVL